MGKKIISAFLSLVLCITNVMGINAATLDEISTLQKDINKTQVSNNNGEKSSEENDGYAVVSNESVSTNSQYTGSFSINNSKYSLNKNLDLYDYKIDINIPFNTKKNKDKLLLDKNGDGKVITPSYEVGDSKDFYVVNFVNNEYESLDATLFYSGTKVNVWVNDNEISEADASKLGKEFENNIYSKVTNYFGKESDVDNDGKINILCYDIQDGFSGSGAYVGGYFYAGDLYDVDYSNKSEIFYMDTYPSLGLDYRDVTNCYETLAHEFQHMINFNQSVLKEGGNDMDTWLNEGMSMAAEQVYTGKSLTSRIDYYNQSSSIAQGHSLLYWDNDGDVLSNYSLSYLFLQYFKLQTGQGDAIFKELQSLNNNNYKDIETLIKKYIDPNLTFGKFLTEFRIALLLNESTGLRGFKGDSNFDEIKTPLYYGGGTDLRGGGAVVKEVDTSNFQIPSDKGNDVTFTIIKEGEESNEKPVISGADDKTIKVGDSFDARKGVSASDKEDGDLTSKIVISGSVDTKKAGVYKLTYSVEDRDSNKTTVTRKITVAAYLKKVENVKASSSSYNSNKITWSKVSGANGYKIYRATSKNGKYSSIKTITSGSTLSYTNTGLQTGKTYYYKVRAYKLVNGSKIYGDFSSVAYAKPVPSSTSVKASSSSYKSNKITWNKVSGASGYKIYRATSKNGKYSSIKTITSGSTLSYTNTGLQTGKTYYYKVRAYRLVNGSKVYGKYSSYASAKPSLLKPSISLSSGKRKAYIKWNKISGANGYEIYRSRSKNGKYSKIKTLTATSYTNSNLSSKKVYYYKVRAYRNVNGKKVYSSYSSIKYIKIK